MRIADTSALYAAVNANDPHHMEARAFLAGQEALVVPAEVLSETISLIQYRSGHAPAIQAKQAIMGFPQVEVQPTPDDPFDDLTRVAHRVHAQNSGLSYVDSVVVAWCQRRKLAAFTYDKEILALLP